MIKRLANGVARILAERSPKWFCRLHRLENHTLQDDRCFLNLYAKVSRDLVAVQPLEDLYNLYRLALNTAKLTGDIAEVGVYRGGSAKLICSVKNGKALHLFDTFEGMPKVRPELDRHKAGDFSDTSLEAVRQYLSGYPGVHFYKGFFPDSAASLAKDARFSLVHLDVDIYESTRAGLDFFYPRMTPGGLLLSHDYRSISCPGVKKAFDEFFANKPEPVIELWKTQCMIVKQ